MYGLDDVGKKYIIDTILDALYLKNLVPRMKQVAAQIVYHEMDDMDVIEDLYDETNNYSHEKARVEAYNKLKQHIERFKNSKTPMKDFLDSMLRDTYSRFESTKRNLMKIIMFLPDKQKK